MRAIGDLRFVPGVAAPEGDSGPALWLVVRERELLVHDEDGIFVAASPDEIGIAPDVVQYLGRVGDHRCLAARVAADTTPPSGARFHDLRLLFGRFDEPLWALAGRAVQILEWDRTHRFCGACATPTESQASERARRCPSCGLLAYPRLAPAVIAAVARDDEILLARSRHFPPGYYSVPAGFVEPGETLEQAVAREIEEETGIVAGEVRYFGSQPWPFPHSLMLGFTARAMGGALRVDPVELEDAGFFRFDAMPKWFRGRISIAGWLIEDFLRRHGAG